MDNARILVADDEEDIRIIYSRILTEAGHDVDSAATGTEVMEKVRGRAYDMVLVDMIMPPSDGVTLLREIKRIRPATLVIVFSGLSSVENVLAAFRTGAYDFLLKPVEPQRLRALASRAVELRIAGDKRRRLAEELDSERLRVLELKRQLLVDDPFRRILGTSPLMGRLVETLREVAQTESTVLLTGESGTGKGLVARTVHDASRRTDGPFVEANCVVYSEGLLHSELFGHERGAFTGAAKLKRGRFELARTGTLFLDEIGEISPATQLLLLRVLQDRTYERVGGEETFEADVRLIAATNRDLQEAMERGAFRSDLYYRLNVIPVHLPPLRDHLEDVPILAQRFLERRTERAGRAVKGFTPDALEALSRHDWPGNVRELDNLVERLAVLCRGERISLDDLPKTIRDAGRRQRTTVGAGTLQEMERERILQALSEAGGNKKQAAARLGIHRSTLYAKLRSYGLTGGTEAAGDEADRRAS